MPGGWFLVENRVLVLLAFIGRNLRSFSVEKIGFSGFWPELRCWSEVFWSEKKNRSKILLFKIFWNPLHFLEREHLEGYIRSKNGEGSKFGNSAEIFERLTNCVREALLNFGELYQPF